jgi:4-hydroxybenzoate polyprenyltransferase
MADLESVKEEFDKLDKVDKRWIAICVVVAVAALVTAALAGSLFGDVIAFALTFAAGWFVHDQWNMVSKSRPRRRATPRRKAAGTSSG